jgi:hypothetical protein
MVDKTQGEGKTAAAKIVQMLGMIRFYRKGFVLVALCIPLSNASTSVAQPSPGRAEVAAEGRGQAAGKDANEEEGPLLNGFSLGAAYTFHILRERDSATTGEPLSTFEHMGGFVLAYDRELIAEHLALTLSKPFYFSSERFDTPFDFVLRGLFRKGSWEGFVGAVVTWNIRVFERERAEQEGEKNKMSLGVGAVIGGCHYFTDRWSLDLELGYAYIPTEDIVEHELSAVLSGVFHFNKRGHGDVDSGTH